MFYPDNLITAEAHQETVDRVKGFGVTSSRGSELQQAETLQLQL